MTRFLPAHDPLLAFDPDLDRARGTLLRYVPPDDGRARDRTRILAFLHEHPDALHRSCLAGHLTGAALVVDHAGERALLTLHRKLGRWLQLGGHCDGDANLAAAALREASEESGIEGLVIDPRPIDVDVHAIPARGDEPEHLHLDVRFLVRAPEGAVARVSSESRELGWFTPAEAEAAGVEESVLRLFRIAFGGEARFEARFEGGAEGRPRSGSPR